MKYLLAIVTVVLAFSSLAQAKNAAAGKATQKSRTPASASFKVHACEGDALARADKLLRLYWMGESNAEVPNLSIDDTVKKVAPITSPDGKRKYDVLEVNGYVYKGSFRMRMIYALLGNECVVMGEEILDLSSL
jgi:hypothetical protein